MLRTLLRNLFARPEQPTTSPSEPSAASPEAPEQIAAASERLQTPEPVSSADVGDETSEAVAQYQRMNDANRKFVEETRPLEREDPLEAVARYQRAVAALTECRDFARAKGLEALTLNETDALAIERLTTCLVKMRLVEEAAAELDKFVEAFPEANEMALVKTARNRVSRVQDPRSEGDS